MEKDTRRYDIFKSIVTIFLILLLLWVYFFLPEIAVAEQAAETGDIATQVVESREQEMETDTLSLPAFPQTNVMLQFNDQNSSLEDEKGLARFMLNENQNGWVPILPSALVEQIGDDYQLAQDESQIWIVRDATGSPLYSLNMADLEWLPITGVAEKEEDTALAGIPDCPKANPPRLHSIGQTVTVVNALIPLRSSPDATSKNFLQPLPVSSILKVVALPVCTEYLDGANLWWGVETEEGNVGWAAEGSAISSVYYLEAID